MTPVSPFHIDERQEDVTHGMVDLETQGPVLDPAPQQPKYYGSDQDQVNSMGNSYNNLIRQSNHQRPKSEKKQSLSGSVKR